MMEVDIKNFLNCDRSSSNDDVAKPMIKNHILNRAIVNSNSSILNRSNLSGIDALSMTAKNRLSNANSNESKASNNGRRSYMSLQERESIDKTVIMDSMKNTIKDKRNQNDDFSDLEWNINVSSEDMD